MNKKIVQSYQTKNDIVFNLLRDQILSGELMPGERITVMSCAADMGVSAIPVREALKRLQQEGLVKIIPHAGAQVVKYNNKKFCEIAEVRHILEPHAAMLATKNLTDDEFDELQKIIAKMEVCVTELDSRRYSEYNTEFHAFIYRRCANITLLETIMSLWDKSHISRNAFVIDTGRMKSSLEEHKALLQCLLTRDEAAVYEAFRKHKEASFLIIKKTLE